MQIKLHKHKGEKMSLTKKQREALKLLKKGENVFLSGEGEQGKVT